MPPAAMLEQQTLFDFGHLGVQNPFKKRYDNFIGGKFVPPAEGQYFLNISPVVGQPFTEIARSSAKDVDLALDAAHAAREAWGRTSVAERSQILNKVADRMEANLGVLALAETLDNGKPIRETTAADLPLAVDHFRYFAGVIRAQEGSFLCDHPQQLYDAGPVWAEIGLWRLDGLNDKEDAEPRQVRQFVLPLEERDDLFRRRLKQLGLREVQRPLGGQA